MGKHHVIMTKEISSQIGGKVRKTLRLLGYFLWSVLTFEVLIGIVDWFGRWDLLNSFMAAHPQVASLFRNPFSYGVLLVLGFVFLRAEQHVKAPRIRARFVNSRTLPNLHTTTMQVMFDTENKKPGWDEHPIDWHWFLEIQLPRPRIFLDTEL